MAGIQITLTPIIKMTKSRPTIISSRTEDCLWAGGKTDQEMRESGRTWQRVASLEKCVIEEHIFVYLLSKLAVNINREERWSGVEDGGQVTHQRRQHHSQHHSFYPRGHQTHDLGWQRWPRSLYWVKWSARSFKYLKSAHSWIKTLDTHVHTNTTFAPNGTVPFINWL